MSSTSSKTPEVEVLKLEEILESIRKRPKISTGCRALDDILGGGVETGFITEFVGEFGAGKTQLCHQLSVMVQLPIEEGGLNGRAVYIDTEGTFRPERIVQIAEYRGIDPKQALKNIKFARIYSLREQLGLIPLLEKLLEDRSFKLVVIDTISALYRLEYAYTSRERVLVLRKLAFFAYRMAQLALEKGIAAVFSNQLVSRPMRGEKPAGGVFLEAFITTRVKLSKLRDNLRRAIVVLSRNPEIDGKSCRFMITEFGVTDSF